MTQKRTDLNLLSDHTTSPGFAILTQCCAEVYLSCNICYNNKVLQIITELLTVVLTDYV